MASWLAVGRWGSIICVALVCALQSSAHHSFASTYSLETVTIEGRIIEFLYRSPHSVVLLTTGDEKREPITWAAEWGTAGQLSREGIEKDTLKPGDRVIISGNPSRNSADHRLRIGSITRVSDGWSWKSSF